MDFELFDLRGKTALVTGASHGIGFAIACGLAGHGAKIAFNSRNPERFDEVLAEYRKQNVDVNGYLCDITDENAVADMVESIERDIGAVDILVNNAGIIKRIPMHEMSAAEFREVVDVDLTAQFIAAKAVLPAMIRKGGGKIINICSLTSEQGRENVAAYSAAKGGLKMLTRNIASEYGKYNIQCNGLGPGYIATPQTEPLRAAGNPFNKLVVSRTPAARWGLPEDLVGPAVFLASSASDFVNGHILYADGGFLSSIGSTCE